MNDLQKQSKKALVQLLNNIGIVCSIIAGTADIIFVLIMVLGVNIDIKFNALILYSIVNSLIGILINILLRFQGVKYAELENQELCEKFYVKKVKETKKPLSIEKWQALHGFLDFLTKGTFTAFSIFGIIYISIEGSKNPIQILITLTTLILYVCFGLISMNSGYDRFYMVQKPYMELFLEEKNKKENEKKGENLCQDLLKTEEFTEH